MTAFWCELAWLGGAVGSGVRLTLDGDGISGVDVGTERAAGDVLLRGLTLPGFANAHSHAFHRVLRSRTQEGGGDFWAWREVMYAAAQRLTPDSYLALATAVFAEMVQAGYTAVGEFHYLHRGPGGVPYADPNAMGAAVIEAARRVGIRLTLLDTCYLHGGIGQPLADVQQRFGDGDADGWIGRHGALRVLDGDAVRIGAAVHSVRAVTPVEISAVAAATIGEPLHAHVSEQPAENEASLAAHERTPTQVLADAGALDGRFCAVHATHLTPVDVDLLGGAGASVCLCPTTERDLADGIGPSAALVAAGVRLCIGSDSHAVIDPFEETRAVELDERLASGRRGTHAVAGLLGMATSNGYAALGWPGGGALAAGAPADFVTIRLDTPRVAGTPPSAAGAAAVYAASASDVHHVVVGGRTVVRDGRHVTIDVVAELGPAIAAILDPTR